MTGLYENIFAIQNDAQLTFLLRSPTITKGYALAFQAFGFLYWDYKDQLPLEEILVKFDEILDDFAYRKI